MSTNDLISALALLVAVAAFGLTFWQGYLNRQHLLLSVKPLVNIDYSVHELKPLVITINNRGLGPAIVEELLLVIEGKKINATDNPGVIESIRKKYDVTSLKYEYAANMPLTGEVIPEKASFHLIEFNASDADTVRTLKKVVESIGVIVAYRCIYGKKYLTSFPCIQIQKQTIG